MTTEKSSNNIGVILLAAGASSRLGYPKQLLLYAGESLLQYGLQIAGASTARQIVVVLGAHADAVIKEIKNNRGVHVVINTEWQEGIASSIRCGIEALVEISPSAEGVILMVCDQPYISSALLNNLIITHRETRKHIVACSYENTLGTPVLFDKTMFPELLKLEGDIGAKRVITQHANEVEVIMFPQGNIDIDTEADYHKLAAGNPESS